jgi:hypothetical protein
MNVITRIRCYPITMDSIKKTFVSQRKKSYVLAFGCKGERQQQEEEVESTAP